MNFKNKNACISGFSIQPKGSGFIGEVSAYSGYDDSITRLCIVKVYRKGQRFSATVSFSSAPFWADEEGWVFGGGRAHSSALAVFRAMLAAGYSFESSEMSELLQEVEINPEFDSFAQWFRGIISQSYPGVKVEFFGVRP